MKDIQFPLTLIPENYRDKVKLKKYNKNDFISSGNSDKVFYICSGFSYFLIYENDEEIIYPYIFGEKEFIGANIFVPSYLSNWEAIVYSDTLEGYEIPKELFKNYILPAPIFLESFLTKATGVLAVGVKAFCVRSRGGTTAYFALVLDEVFNKLPVISFDKYSNFTRLLSISKAGLYNITKDFIKEGIIKKEKNKLYLLDRKKLRQYYASI